MAQYEKKITVKEGHQIAVDAGLQIGRETLVKAFKASKSGFQHAPQGKLYMDKSEFLQTFKITEVDNEADKKC